MAQFSVLVFQVFVAWTPATERSPRRRGNVFYLSAEGAGKDEVLRLLHLAIRG